MVLPHLLRRKKFISQTMNNIQESVEKIIKAKHAIAFTGAGISVESGIPPFRGPNGLWSKYDPRLLDINYYYANTEKSWKVIYEIFYQFFKKAEPNKAHLGLAALEKKDYLKSIITQNIDNLHQKAGSKTIYEFHGNSQILICPSCKTKYPANEESLESIPPHCPKCNHILKPDFVFFGEQIPEYALHHSFEEAHKTDLLLIVGTTGEIHPAALIPPTAKRYGATIIEINPEKSNYTDSITDIFLQGEAGDIIKILTQTILRD